MPRLRLVAMLLLAAVAASGCGREVNTDDAEPPALLGPPDRGRANLGFPEFATKNTTRVPGSEPVQIAAAVVRAVYPDPARKPDAVTLVDRSDWRVAVAAAALMADPFNAPVLYTDGTDMPDATSAALSALAPEGSAAAGNAQVIRIGNVARPPGLKSSDVTGAGALALTSADDPSFAVPAAGYAAKTGDPVLFVTRDAVPPETRAALAALAGLARPQIYILGPSKLISPKVSRDLRRLGRVERLGGQDAVTNAIAMARYRRGSFGWGIVDPGHGLVFTADGRPMNAAAAAPLSASGKYGPLLLLDDSDRVPQALQQYLLDIQPGYQEDPVRGVYNHGWIVGTRSLVSLEKQARIDALLEIVPVRTPDAPPQP
jgi:putative cell wall-binding protein